MDIEVTVIQLINKLFYYIINNKYYKFICVYYNYNYN